MIKILLVAIALGLIACSNATAPLPDTPVQQLRPGGDYRKWWGELESCSGLTGNLDDITFLLVDSLDQKTVGRWYADGNRIYLLRLYANSEVIVKHEMMHALLHGGSDHPVYYFNGVCGDLEDGAD